MSRIRTRVLRLKAIETALIRAGNGGIKIGQLAKSLSTNRRTIYRDFVCLSADFCIPIYQNDDGLYCIDRTNYSSPFPGATR